MHIVLVDDEVEICLTVKEFLVRKGHQVTMVDNGADALATMRQNPDVKLVISDVRMPGMDGLELLREIHLLFPGMPVILFTGHGDENLAMAALENGAYGYLKKPLGLQELKGHIDRLEERDRIEKQLVAEYGLDTAAKQGQAISGDEIAALCREAAGLLVRLERCWPAAGGGGAQAPQTVGELREVIDRIGALAGVGRGSRQRATD